MHGIRSAQSRRSILLRPFRSADCPGVREAIDESLAEVQQWLPWGSEEPSSAERLAARIDKYAAECDSGTAWRLALVDETSGRFLGSGALLPYSGPASLEVGYWIRNSEAGRGLATRAAAALIRYAFRERAIERMELWTRPGNAPSAAVARRLGFQFRGQLETSRAGASPELFDIFDLPNLSALRVPEDPYARIEL